MIPFFRLIVSAAVVFLAYPAPPCISGAPDRGAAVVIASTEMLNLCPGMSYLEDGAGLMKLEEVSADRRPWTSVRGESVNFGYTSSTYWFRFAVDNRSGREFPCYLEISYPLLDYLDLYIPEPDGSFSLKRAGDRYPFRMRDVKDRNFLFTLDLRPGVSTFYLRVSTGSSLNFEPVIWSPLGYINRMNTELPLTWIYYGLLLVMAIYNLFLFVSIRERSYIYYALFIFSWILFQFTLLGYSFQYLWPDWIWWANNSLPFFMCVTMALVVKYGQSYVDAPRNYPFHNRLLVYAGLAPLLFLAALSLSIDYALAIRISTAFTMVFTVGFYSLVLYLAFKKDRQAMFIAIGFAFLCVGLVLYVLKSFGVLPSTLLTRHFIQVGISAMVILFSLGMADKINFMKNQLEDLNVNLEKKVLQRTDELNAANEELEAMNENLVALNEELESAQGMMNRDMAMAVNVQKKFFPEIPPGTSDWEVAFHFRPRSGISGDLYDFYVANESLEGISLFDVSGHGISSGLITMIAKTILFRSFNEGRETGLNEVIKKFNTDLIKEIGRVGNYLTGIMLRFSGSSVEYVNAGHPDLLARSKATGDVRLVGDPERDAKGHFLGLEVMDKDFGIITFSAEKGDSVLLFSDCLMECAGGCGGEFGLERIMDSFRRAPEQSAHGQLEFILREFYAFTEKDVLSDDLTVILAKKIS